RIDGGRLRPEDSSPLVREVLDLCRHYQRATAGHFNAWAGGHLDPSGLVKGWAIDRACRILERFGGRNYVLDAGGDVMARGHNGSGGPWRVGIRHPVERNLVARVVLASDLAVATSGTYEKGAHIIDGVTERPARELVSLTVVGPDMVEADVFATAAFAAGEHGLELIAGLPGYEAYAIWPDLHAAWTPGLDALWA
ncbi:MAG: FAD:protein FMN transferase, partial [Candidatus Dormibacteraeota bacterium]|nr:FAD:protein FMN transferase [Candidatus Dormibacteraeota bacterium]